MTIESGNGGVLRRTTGRGRLFGSILDTVGDTPVVQINRLAPPNVRMFVKCEFFNPAASVKDRLALNIIEEAEREGKLEPGQTVIEASSGNTGIGLAMVCAAKGYPLVVTMVETFSVERRQLMRMFGAKVVLTPKAEKGFGMVKKARELAEANGWFLAHQFETDANAAIHESTTAAEIVGDFEGEKLDYFVTGYGTGGTVAGVGRVIRKTWPDVKIVLSEPANAQLVGIGQAAGEECRGRAGGEPPGLRAASDPGLDAGLHPEGASGGDRRALLRRAHPGRRPGRHEVGARARREGGHPHRRLRRLDLRRGDEGRRDCARGLDDPRDAARHRRALPLDPALRALRRRHERGRARHHALDARSADGLTRAMCGRYMITSGAEAMARLFEADLDFGANMIGDAARPNVSPTEAIPVVVSDGGRRRIVAMRWGLVPPWYKAPNGGPLLINARSESVATKPAFAKAVRERRCLIPADGFYEWQGEKGAKTPFVIRRPDGGPFAFAGLWESWRGQPTAAIVTCEANATLAPIHERMPVVLAPADYAALARRGRPRCGAADGPGAGRGARRDARGREHARAPRATGPGGGGSLREQGEPRRAWRPCLRTRAQRVKSLI